MEVIGRILIAILAFIFEVIFLEVIGGILKFIYRKLNSAFNLISGNRKTENENPIKQVEKKFLYKNITLKENLSKILFKGLDGAVLEIIDSENACVEFYKPNSKNQIEENGEIVFKVNLNQIELNKI